MSLKQILAAMAGSAMLASAAFAGALGYTYGLPGETTVVTETATNPANEVGSQTAGWGTTAGTWADRSDTGISTGDPGGLGALISASGLDTGMVGGGGFTGATTLSFPTMNLYNGPISLYWTATMKLSGAASTSSGQAIIATGVGAGYSPNGQFVSPGSYATTPGEMYLQKFGMRNTYDFTTAKTVGTAANYAANVMMNSGNVSGADPGLGTWGGGEQQSGIAPHVPTDFITMQQMQMPIKMKSVAYITSDDTIAQQLFFYNTAPAVAAGWQPLTAISSDSLAQGTALDVDGAINQMMIVNNSYVNGENFAGDATGKAKITNVVLTQAAPGNTNGDPYVDSVDYFNSIAGQGAVTSPSAGKVHIVYNAATGDVKLDLTDSGPINAYTIQIANFSQLLPTNLANWLKPLGTAGTIANLNKTFGEVMSTGQSSASILDLGMVVAAGKVPTLADFGFNTKFGLGTATYSFDVVVPEPASLGFLALGGLLALRRRVA